MNKDQNMDFVHLHTRSHFSRGESICTTTGLLSLAQKNGQTSLALTDRNILAGHPEFHSQAWIQGVSPVLGMELLIDSYSHLEEPGIHSAIFPLVLLARDSTGYQNLINLSNTAQLQSQGSIKRVSREMLSVYSKGLIALSGGMEGELSQSYLQEKPDTFAKGLKAYLDIFGRDHFFLELQDRGDSSDIDLNRFLVDAAHRYCINYVATADIRYLEQTHHESFQIYRQQTQDTGYQEVDFRYSWMRSSQEMQSAFGTLPDALHNTLLITDMCQYQISFKPDYPTVDVPADISSLQYLKSICKETLVRLFPQEIPLDYSLRLDKELEIISQRDLSWYFILLRRIVNYPLSQNIQITGGHANASLVSYLTGISPLDPVRYGLVFDLWLTSPLPRLELNMEKRHRDRIIEWVIRLTGKDSTAYTGVYENAGLFSALMTCGKFLGIPGKEINSLAEALQEYPVSSLTAEELKHLHEVQQILARPQEVYPKWINTALSLMNVLIDPQKTVSDHLVICASPLQKLLPVFSEPGKNLNSVQFDTAFLQEQAFLTLGVHGIEHLDRIGRCFGRLSMHPLIQVRPEDIPLQDESAWEILSYGETQGIYGFQDRKSAKLLSRYRPENLQDLALVDACSLPGQEEILYRIMTNRDNPGLRRDFIPVINDILDDTHGIMIYQEQLYRILSSLSGCSRDYVLQMMHSMQIYDLSHHDPLFSEWKKAVHTGGICMEEDLTDILEYCISRASQLTSKAQSMDTAWTAYVCAWLKAHHYALFMQEIQRYQWTEG